MLRLKVLKVRIRRWYGNKIIKLKKIEIREKKMKENKEEKGDKEEVGLWGMERGRKVLASYMIISWV